MKKIKNTKVHKSSSKGIKAKKERGYDLHIQTKSWGSKKHTNINTVLLN